MKNRFPRDMSARQIKDECGFDLHTQPSILCDDHYYFDKGAILILDKDDSTPIPAFRELARPERTFAFVAISRLAPFVPKTAKQHALWAKLRLKGVI